MVGTEAVKAICGIGRDLEMDGKPTRVHRKDQRGARKRLSWLRWFAFAWFVLILRGQAHALDTLECFDVGLSDFEAYASFEGVGKPEPDRGVSADVLLGIGITPWLSGQVFGGGQGNQTFSEGSGFFGFSVFGTPVDTDHFDLDAGMHVTVGGLGGGTAGPAGHSQAEFTFTPFVELNLDSDPDMNGYGVFLDVAETLGGRDESRFTPLGEELRDFTLTPGTALLLAGYWRPAEKHELLLGYDMAFEYQALPGEKKIDIGGIALGYNVTLSDAVELITQVNFDLPQTGEYFGVDFMVGILTTLPSFVP
jgi:hypothetical protein